MAPGPRGSSGRVAPRGPRPNPGRRRRGTCLPAPQGHRRAMPFRPGVVASPVAAKARCEGRCISAEPGCTSVEQLPLQQIAEETPYPPQQIAEEMRSAGRPGVPPKQIALKMQSAQPGTGMKRCPFKSDMLRRDNTRHRSPAPGGDSPVRFREIAKDSKPWDAVILAA
jgi:hypothetical protein